MLAKPYDWETCQMPLNVMDVHYRSFQKQVLPVCLKKQVGVIGMKGLGGRVGHRSPRPGVTVEEAYRYVLSLPIASQVSGIDSMEGAASRTSRSSATSSRCGGRRAGALIDRREATSRATAGSSCSSRRRRSTARCTAGSTGSTLRTRPAMW